MRLPRGLACVLVGVAAAGATMDLHRPLRAAQETPRELRWAGDPEGGAPFVESSPTDPDTLVGFDVEIADLIAHGLNRSPRFILVAFASIDQSVARGDAEIGLSGRDADASRFRTLHDLAGRRVATLGGTIAYEILLHGERQDGLTAVSYEDDVHP